MKDTLQASFDGGSTWQDYHTLGEVFQLLCLLKAKQRDPNVVVRYTFNYEPIYTASSATMTGTGIE
jgi:hypothetical protein